MTSRRRCSIIGDHAHAQYDDVCTSSSALEDSWHVSSVSAALHGKLEKSSFFNMQRDMFLWDYEHTTWLKQDVCCGFNRQWTGNVMLIQLSAFAAFWLCKPPSSNHKSSFHSSLFIRMHQIVVIRTGNNNKQ